MVFKCAKGMFELKKNYREAFNLEAFLGKYLEEYFDKDMYIVGDISSEILRLKGFNTDPKSENYYGFIEDYLEISCAYGCPFYVLRRIKTEEEFNKLDKENLPVDTEDDRIIIHPMQKENFDKESLILNTSQKGKPNIVIDPRKINSIPKGELPEDLKDDTDTTVKKNQKEEEKPVVTETFVSASEGFDPSKMKDRRRNQDKKNPKDNRGKNDFKENKPHDKQKPKNDGVKEDNNNNQNNRQGFNKNKNHFKKNKNFNGPKPDKQRDKQNG